MNKNTSIVEINGKRYDAVTGQLVGVVKRMASQVKPAAGVIDGFIRKPSHLKTIVKRPATPNTPHQPQKSQTLMRSAVAKYAQARTAAANTQLKARSPKPKPGQVLRAKTIPQNQKVNHFTKPLFATKSNRKNPALEGQVLSGSAGSAMARSGGTAATNTQAIPSLVAGLSQHHLERLLDEALTRADYHKDALRRQLAGDSPWGHIKLLPKWLSLGAGSLAVLLLAGFFAWQNIPQISMRLAATKTHVSAAVPSYTPSGYSFASPVSHSAKAVTIKYQAGSDTAQNFSITQQSSNWDSSTLAANVSTKSTQVQTSQVSGTTVYIYGNNNDASWVNHGVLDTLNNQAGLSSDQILKIAGSMQ